MDAKKISIKLAPSKMMENLHVCRPVPEQKRLYKKGCGDGDATPPFHQNNNTAHLFVMRIKSSSWHERNKLLASPQEARPQGISLQHMQHGQRQHGDRQSQRKQNTTLICDVSNKLNEVQLELEELLQASRSPIVIGLVQLPFVRSAGTRRERIFKQPGYI